MKPLFSDSRPLDERARRQFGLTTETMMEHAASALEDAVIRALSADRSGDVPGCGSADASADVDVLIVCGSGDNGGDGYALSRRLTARGVQCAVYVARPAKSPACVAQKARAESAGIRYVEDCAGPARILVDCLFGSGFHGTPDDATAALISQMNGIPAWKIACDIPSCLSAAVLSQPAADSVFRADETITMGALKTVLYEDFAKDYVGRVICAPLGIPRDQFEGCGARPSSADAAAGSARDAAGYVGGAGGAPCAGGAAPAPEAWLLDEADLRLPHRTKLNSHKGTYGHAALITGDKCGAGIIAGTAAFGFGAGLVTLVTEHDLAAPAYLRQLKPDEAPRFAESTCMLMQSTELPLNMTAAAMGMGLGRDATATARASRFLEAFSARPEAGVVLDADICYHPALPAFLKARSAASPKEGSSAEKTPRTVLTPHPKEFSALLELCGLGKFSVKDIGFRRLELVQLFCRAFPGTVLLLKGANPLIARARPEDGQLEVYVNAFGMPCLSKGGSGDVLSGLVAALLAQGYGALDAAVSASLAHALASRRIKNDYAMTPFMLIDEIGRL